MYSGTDPGAASRRHVSRAWVYAADGRYREAGQELQLALDACADGPARAVLADLRGLLPEGTATASRPVDFPVTDTGRRAPPGTGPQSPAASRTTATPVARQTLRPGASAGTPSGQSARSPSRRHPDQSPRAAKGGARS